jgi:hypothetical protein
MFTNFFNGIRAAAGSSFGSTNEDVRAPFFAGWSTTSDTPAATFYLQSTLPVPPANAMSLQPNNAVAQSPSGTDLPPNPYSRDSPPAPGTSRVVIDLSSPTKRSSRPSHKESHLETSRPRLQKSEKSEDERRLVGDYT